MKTIKTQFPELYVGDAKGSHSSFALIVLVLLLNNVPLHPSSSSFFFSTIRAEGTLAALGSSRLLKTRVRLLIQVIVVLSGVFSSWSCCAPPVVFREFFK
jgi:hypothetical protein